MMTENEHDEAFADAVKVGARRAGVHLVRAGIEVVSGISAFIDELVKAREGVEERKPPQRIELE